MPKISIALATYNGEKYLREQLDSILSQTIPYYEVVVCDDNSTDSTWKILNEYAGKDPRIKLFRNETNLGYLKNFERILPLCSGDYIALSDQDDIWLPDHLEILLNNIGDKMLCVGDAEIMDAEGHRKGVVLSHCENLDFVPEDDLEKAFFIFYYRSPYYGMAMLLRKEFVDIILPIPTVIAYHDKWIASLACFHGGLNYIHRPVTLYRRHGDAVSGIKIHRSRIRNMFGHLLLSKKQTDRLELAKEIETRLRGNLEEKQHSFLRQVEEFYCRRDRFGGRIVNFLFRIKNYKRIYGSK